MSDDQPKDPLLYGFDGAERQQTAQELRDEIAWCKKQLRGDTSAIAKTTAMRRLATIRKDLETKLAKGDF